MRGVVELVVKKTCREIEVKSTPYQSRKIIFVASNTSCCHFVLDQHFMHRKTSDLVIQKKGKKKKKKKESASQTFALTLRIMANNQCVLPDS